MADSEDAEVVLNKTMLTAKVETPNQNHVEKKKWSNSDIEKLIEEYEAITYLWDTFSADYRPKRRKNCRYGLDDIRLR